MPRTQVDLYAASSNAEVENLPAGSSRFSLRGRPWLGLLGLVVVALVGLGLVSQVKSSYLLNIGAAQAGQQLNNFYEAEGPAQDRHRWAQPQAQIQLRSLGSNFTVCLTTQEITTGRRLEMGLLYGQDKFVPLKSFPLEPGRHRYCATTSGLAAFWPGNYTLYKDGFLYNIWFGPTLQINTDVYQPKGDRRELGALIETVEVTSGEGQLEWPNALQIAITLLLVIGSWGLVYSLKRGGWWPVGAGGATLAVWLGLLAIARPFLSLHLEFILYLVVATELALAAVRFAGPLALADLRRGRYLLRAGQRPDTVTRAVPLTQTRTALVIVLMVVAGLVWFSQAGLSLFVSTSDSFWGLQKLLPWPVWVGLVLILLLALVVAWLNKLPGGRWPRINRWWAGLGATVVFYLLRVGHNYGDGNEIVNKLNLFLQYRAESGRSDFLIWREREPLDFALHFVLWRALLRFEWWKPEYTYVFTSVLAGGLFVVVAISLAKLLARSVAECLLIVGLLLGAGTTLVFYGYIESYTLIALVALLYTYLAVLALRDRLSIIWPALALIIMVMLHPQAVFLGPSFALLLLARAGFFRQVQPDWRRLARECGLAALVAVVALLSFGFLFVMYNYGWAEWGIAQRQFGGSDNGAFKPLLASAVRPGSREFYPILSGDFLLFQLNLQARLAPLALPLLAVIFGWWLGRGRWRQKGAGRLLLLAGVSLFFVGLTWVGAQAVVWLALLGLVVQGAGLWLLRRHLRDLTGLLLASLALYTWLFSLAWNPDLGSNDWDLLSLNGIFTSLLAAYALNRALGGSRHYKRLVFVLLACALTLQAAWVLSNAFF